MKYVAYKMSFQTGVHFGNGMLSGTDNHFLADTLFSALCMEALREGEQCLEHLYQLTKSGNILFSDSFPFIEDTLYVPKPMISITHDDEQVADRKKWKKLRYIPMERIPDYLSGKLDVDSENRKLSELGHTDVRQMVSLCASQKSEPYAVGVYDFHKGNGLYFLVGYEKQEDLEFVEALIDALGYEGIGGKVSSGLGKFFVLPVELKPAVTECLRKQTGRFVLLTTALPTESEMPEVLEDASYLPVRRGGFVRSASYSEEPVKKREQYFLQAGAVVRKRFLGDVYQVGGKGRHPVWRYGKPLFMEVSI